MLQPEGVLAATIVFQVLAVALPCLRLWAVQRYGGGVRTLPQVVATGFYTLGCVLVTGCNSVDFKTLHDELLYRKEYSQDIADLLMTDSKYIKLTICSGLAYYSALWSFKAAFLAFYWNLLTKAKSKIRYALRFTAALTAVTYVVIIVTYVSSCRPFHNNWSPDLETLENCSIIFRLPQNTAAYCLDFCTDILIALIPISIISTRELGRAERWALAFVFTLGIASPVAATVRYALIRRIILAATIDFNVQRIFNFMSSIEYWTALVAFPLPAFRMLLLKMLGRHTEISAIRAGVDNIELKDSGHGRSWQDTVVDPRGDTVLDITEAASSASSSGVGGGSDGRAGEMGGPGRSDASLTIAPVMGSQHV